MFLGNVGRQVFKVGVYSIRIYSIEVNAKLFEIIPIIGDGESFSITEIGRASCRERVSFAL